MDAAHRGEAALAANDYPSAISHYTIAIAQSPSATTYYLKRSIAYIRTGDFTSALADAEIAVVGAHTRAKRELIAQAQLRRGIALYNLGTWADAGFCFGLARKYDEKEKSVGTWEEKCRLKLRELEEGDEGKIVRVKEVPDVKVPEVGKAGKAKEVVEQKTSAAVASPISANGNATTAAAPGLQSTQTAPKPVQGVQTPADKIRHEWYQNNESVYLSLFVKGAPKEQTTIDIEAGSVSISFPLATGSQYDFSLEPLFAAIDPTTSTSKILGTKIEVVLKKAQPGQKWSSLEGTTPITSNRDGQGPTANDAPRQASVASSNPPATAPAYPTSSRTGPKNWDKIVSSYTKPPKPTSTSTSKPPAYSKAAETTADDASLSSAHSSDDETTTKADKEKENDYVDFDDEEGDDVNKFFKQLYKGASAETRRAMVKSYQESGGTALSTNWEEVKKAPVPVSPPDGMEEKKWEI